MNEFNKYATKHLGMNSTTLHSFESKMRGYMSPNIIEERPQNVAIMSVFDRLMVDTFFSLPNFI